MDLALGPWAEAWEACKMLRAHGYDATLDTALFVRGGDTFRLDPMVLTVVAGLPDDLTERVNRSIYGALNEGQARGIYYSTPLISEHDYENATQWHFSY